MAIYTLSESNPDKPRFEGDPIQCGTSYDVLRDEVKVAAIHEHPTQYEGRAFVSMHRIRWAGPIPDIRNYPKDMDSHLFFDFVSEFTTSAEVLSEVERRVERIFQWREAQKREVSDA